MLQIRFLLLFIVVFHFFSSSLKAQEGPIHFLDDSVSYMWPTSATQQLASTFAETRSAHLHSGIDIRTWGREGYPVFASRDGIIYRIAIGPRGYGNVIYMKHGDESYTVYAHLNRFELDLQAYADSIRMIDYSFELDRIIEHESFFFKQGDVIGFTGSTGVGPPHLHFEIRNPDFEPINPLLSNLAIRDDLPPVFSRLAVEFLHPETLHRTGHTIISLSDQNDGYHFGKVTVSDPIGLAVNVHDRANLAPNVYAVHSLKLVVDSDTLFQSQVDHFEFGDGKNMFLDRSYPILAQTRQGFQRLYKVEGNRLPFYKKMVNRGVLNLDEGTYSAKIIATDIYGNASEATLDLVVENSHKKSEISHIPAYPLFEAVNDLRLFRWRKGEIPTSESLLASTGSNIDFLPNRHPVHLFSVSEKTTRKILHPSVVQSLSSSDQKVWLHFPSIALYDTLDIKMRVVESPSQIDIHFNPSHIPLDTAAYFNYILPERFKNNNQIGLFAVDQFRGRESFINADISNGIIRAKINDIKDLRIKEDRTAPWVGRPRIVKNLAENYIVKIPTVDQSTGIDYRASIITINGERGIVEFDPEDDFLIYYNPGFNPQQQNVVKYEIYDGVGNRTASEITIPYMN